jgi:transcriptional regulator with XRE-family HTH domain
MAIDPSALKTRANTIGALLQEARQAKDRSLDECALAIGVPPHEYEAYESGEKMISLPELELASYFLETPLSYFWEMEPALGGEDGEYPKEFSNREQLLRLRNRMIGALLRQARLEASLSLEDLAARTGLEASRLEAYEWGQQAVPLPELEALCGLLQRSIREFQDQHGPVGEWNARQRALQDFLALPLELQVFVSKPINRPYLDLALRLSDMKVEKLRAVAEGLLEITY